MRTKFAAASKARRRFSSLKNPKVFNELNRPGNLTDCRGELCINSFYSAATVIVTGTRRPEM